MTRAARSSCAAVALLALIAGAGRAHAASAAPADDGRARIATLEAAAARGDHSAALYYDLGNAYARRGDLGHAILAYERARLADPRAPDVAANLAQARRRAGVTVARPWLRRAVAKLTTSEWAWLTAIGTWIALLALLARTRLARGRRLAGLVALLAALLVGSATFGWVARERAQRDVIVVAPTGAPVRLAPSAMAALEGHAAAGQRGTVLARHGDFLRLRLDGAGSGWVPATALSTIGPGP